MPVPVKYMINNAISGINGEIIFHFPCILPLKNYELDVASLLVSVRRGIVLVVRLSRSGSTLAVTTAPVALLSSGDIWQ